MDTSLQAKLHNMEFKTRTVSKSDEKTPEDEAKIQAAIKQVMNRRTRR